MKVILLSTFYKPSIGGVEKQVEQIYTNLITKGLEVKVYTTDASHSKNQRLKNIENLENVVRFKYWFGFGFFFRFAPTLVLNLLTAKFDVIHIHNSHDAHILPIIFIKLLRRKKLVVTGHNPYLVDNSKRGSGLSGGVKFFDFVLSVFSFAIDKYIALLESEKEYVSTKLRIKKDKTVVIPNGIKDDYFDSKSNLENTNVFFTKYKVEKSKYKLVLGCLCRMDSVKGLQNLKLAVDQNPDCLFIFAGGDGGYLSELKNIYKNSVNVFFTNEFLDIKESLDFYSFIDVFLLPSLYEAFGLTLVEAMTQSKYIIASSKVGIKDILSDNYSMVINPIDFEGWSSAIEKIKHNKDLYILNGKEAAKHTLDYKWDNITSSIINVYKDILL